MIPRIQTTMIVLLVGACLFSHDRRNALDAAIPPWGDPIVRTSVSPDTVKVAQSFVVTIEVEVDTGTKVAFDKAPETIGPLSVFNVQDQLDLPVSGPSDRRLFVRRLTLDSLESGEIAIPSMPIAISDTSSSSSLNSPSISINVVSEFRSDSKDEIALRDIQPSIQLETAPQTKTSSVWPIAMLMTAVAASLAVITLAVWKARRRSRFISTYRVAKDRLAKLESSLNASSKASETFQRLEDTIKKLIELETPIAATSLSNDELLIALADHLSGSPPPTYLKALHQIFATSERARFAKAKLEVSELQDATRRVALWIDSFSQANAKEQG